jgi:enolase
MKITNLSARRIFNSKGNPTIEVEVTLENNIKALGQVPSGTSSGSLEAHEIDVFQAIENVKQIIKPSLLGQSVYDQKNIDQILIKLDGTENKSKLGANAILGCSMAVCRAAARAAKQPLFQYLGNLINKKKFLLPRPMILMLEGGKHGDWATEIQEFMVMPAKDRFKSFAETLDASRKIFFALEETLKRKQYSLGVGLEGAFAPKELNGNNEAFELILEAIEEAGFEPKKDFVIAIDAAASEFYSQFSYILKSMKKAMKQDEWFDQVKTWINEYPIWSLEDMFNEDDWDNWTKLNYQFGKNHQIVGDDLTVTNIKLLSKAIEKQAINSIIIKPNQIGTVSETLDTIKLAKQNSITCVVSHRSGETNDNFIADLVVGAGCSQCKFGAITRGERVAKYNRLLKIEEQLK